MMQNSMGARCLRIACLTLTFFCTVSSSLSATQEQVQAPLPGDSVYRIKLSSQTMTAALSS